MPNCTNCSAPLPPESLCCAYCGSRNDVDLKGVHYNTTHASETQRACPRCAIPLNTIDLKLHGGVFLIERCETCLGLFFDPGELEALLEATVANVFEINRKQLANIGVLRNQEYGVTYIRCPVCSTVMNRVNFGTRSGVIVDRCKEHGVWLDGGELRHLFEWMKAGGKLLDKERQAELKKLEAAEEQKRRSGYAYPDAAGGFAGSSDFDTFGGMLRKSDPDMFDMLKSVVRFFLK